MLPNGEEFLIGNKVCAGLLLDKKPHQSFSSSRGVILQGSDVNLLVWHQIEHQFASSLVLFDILGLLLLVFSGGVLLLAIHKASEAFGAQESLHLITAGGVVVFIQRLNVVVVWF